MKRLGISLLLLGAACGDGDPQATSFTLSLTFTGAGTITSAPAGLSCASPATTCAATFPRSATVVLTATPADGQRFEGFTGGGCGATSPCTVTLSADTTLTATFDVVPTLIDVTVTPATVTVDRGSTTQLVAKGLDQKGRELAPQPVFAWESDNVAIATVDANGLVTGVARGTANITAINSQRGNVATVTVNAATVALSLRNYGAGSGRVVSDPAGLDCRAGNCAHEFPANTTVTLTAMPDAGSTLKFWAGHTACTTTGPCVITLGSPAHVEAQFDPEVPSSPVQVALSGAGVVTSDPSGIDCGNGHTPCSKYFPNGSTVTFTATVAEGGAFAGWGAMCFGAGTAATCTKTIDGPTGISATFVP